MADDPTTSITAATHTQHEDPTGDAGQAAASYLTVALALAQRVVNRSTAKADRRADGEEPATAAERPDRKVKDPLEAAREVYAPMLGRDRGRSASSAVALAAWEAASPFAEDHRDAAKAAGRAEDRLRVLHPDAMARYDVLRAGLDPLQAMREVVPLVTAEIANPSARVDFAPMLTDSRGRDAISQQALAAWTAAVPLREHIPDADLAASRAEDRLRELHPEAMAYYDDLRASRTSTEAVREVTRTFVLVHPDEASLDAGHPGLRAATGQTLAAGPQTMTAAEITAARQDIAPMLAWDWGGRATSDQALAAWKSSAMLQNALPLNENVTLAGQRARQRLDELHPEVMQHYLELRRGHSHAETVGQLADIIEGRAQASDIGPAAPPAPAITPLFRTVQEALPPDLAEAVLADPNYPKLAAALFHAETTGADPARILRDAAAQREMTSAKAPAQVLAYRMEQGGSGTEFTGKQRAVSGDSPVTSLDRSSAATAAAGAAQVPAAPAPGAAPQSTSEAGAYSRPNAAAIASLSYPTPITTAMAPALAQRWGATDFGALAAGMVLAREADVLAGAGRDAATTPDDRSTPRIDEHHDGVVAAVPLDARSVADDSRAGALLTQATEPAAASTSAATSAATGAGVGVTATAAPAAAQPTAGAAPAAADQQGAGKAVSGSTAAAVAAQSFPTPLTQATTAQAAKSATAAPAARPVVQQQSAPPARRR